SARKSDTSRAALALDIRFDASIWPASGRSRSANSAPRGSAAIAAIVSPTGPKPNLWRPSAAAAFAEFSPLFALMGNLEDASRAPRPHQQLSLWQKLWCRTQKVQQKHYDPFIYNSGRRTACGTESAAVSIVGRHFHGNLHCDGRIDRYRCPAGASAAS